ncbi:alpha-soluble NSF attachment protein [Acrasis kona]|uniref:Alpha-soluble NSF attachment protein n=1 Tax=Acrasis kona TaxID=1008807 RepID=A0AAW2ZLH5_9EUKA
MSKEEGDRYVAQADKKMNSLFNFSGNKWQDGLDLYEKAIAMYKLSNNWIPAAKTLRDTVQIYQKLKNPLKAAAAYAEAATYFAKSGEHADDAQFCLDKAINMYVDAGKLFRAAELEEEMAQVYEEESDMLSAVRHYRKAADFYEADNHMARVPRCLQKVAQLDSLDEKYEDPAKIFEIMAYGFLKDKMLRVKARPLFLSAVLCHIAKQTKRDFQSACPVIDGEYEKDDDYLGNEIDAEPVREKFEEYIEKDYTLKDSAEGKLINGIIKSMEKQSIPKFEDAVRTYNNNYKEFDEWTTTILLRIKSGARKAWTVGSLV